MSLADLFVPTLSPAEVVVRAAFAYLVLLLLFRVFARTQTARKAGFDVAVMFLVGTALRKTIVADDASLTSGAIALTTLFSLDWIMSFLTWRNARLSFVVEGRPRQIVKDGKPIQRALRRTRINEHDLQERLREHGTEDLARVRAAYVERNGTITVLLRE